MTTFKTWVYSAPFCIQCLSNSTQGCDVRLVCQMSIQACRGLQEGGGVSFSFIWIWLSGWTLLDLTGLGWTLLDLAGFGWIWLDFTGFGWNLLDLVGLYWI